MIGAPAGVNHREAEEAEVQRVRAALSRSPLLDRLFTHLCRKYFDGNAGQLNELNIAIEVFGRSAAFDRTQDSIARVEAHRLRKRLKQYYETEGKYHTLRIELPAGSYVPVFRRAEEAVPDVNRAPAMPLEEPKPEVLVSLPAGPPAAPVLDQPRRPRSRMLWYIAGATLVAVIFGLTRIDRGRDEPPVERSPRAAAVLPGSAIAPSEGAVRFLCGYSGSPHIGRLGELWNTDEYFQGGGSWPSRRGFIRRASDPFLFQSTRTGQFSYDIPVRPGVYELHLYFVETEYGEEMGGGENTRTMQINLNGATLFGAFDPLSDAGGPRIADIRVFKDVQPESDGKVHLSFLSQRGQPMVSAIELVPGVPHAQLPIRIVTQNNSYTDHTGRVWAPDNYYVGGQFFTDKPPVSGTPDPMMFTSERAGNFSYAIPVDARGTYSVKLYFAETYFGPEASGVGGAGSRLFNVVSDSGVMLLDHFDIYKEAGALRAIEKTFHGLRPNPQGKLMLRFEPVSNYASVFAIEVLDESK